MNNMKLSLAFSPCPNDTFIFDAMVHNRIDTEGVQFCYQMSDVEELNKKAFSEEFDITKLSFHAFLHLQEKYQLLNSGAAFGERVGPLIICKKGFNNKDYSKMKIAIPGEFTTANLLLSLFAPETKERIPMLFSDIEDAVLNDEVDAGLVIHETRFTYKDRGLEKIIDLGEWWYNKTLLPIPLGGIAVRRSMDYDLKLKIDRILKRSVEFAMKNPNFSSNFIKENAQNGSDNITEKHISTYVNGYSISVGKHGKEAVDILLKEVSLKNVDTTRIFPIFVDSL